MIQIDLKQLESLVMQLPEHERAALIARLQQSLREPPEKKGAASDLHGMWKGLAPDDFDIDAALHEIRSEWMKELDDYTA